MIFFAENRRRRAERSSRPPKPDPLHAQAPRWRAHLAGVRGGPPGLAAEVLLLAGLDMGYDARVVWDATPIGAGRRAWAQVLFTRPRTNEDDSPLTVGIPRGEADLLLGFDRTESLRAVSGSAGVAHAPRTCAVVNLGLFDDELDTKRAKNATTTW